MVLFPASTCPITTMFKCCLPPSVRTGGLRGVPAALHDAAPFLCDDGGSSRRFIADVGAAEDVLVAQGELLLVQRAP